MRQASEIIAVVTRGTRLELLKRKRATLGAAKFALRKSRMHEAEQRKEAGELVAPMKAILSADAEASFGEYEDEDKTQAESIAQLKSSLDLGYPLIFVDREMVPTFDFGRCLAVVVVGQDGLVANAAKYVGDVPIVAVNPDPERIDGVLLPYGVANARLAVRKVIARQAAVQHVTLAQVTLNDGQSLLAFNDFFVGRDSHASARYTLRAGGGVEAQSSSGVIVATGAGSTGWLSSMFNMMRGFSEYTGQPNEQRLTLNRDARRLVWAVREPFVSNHSQANLVVGLIEEGAEIVIESIMPNGGVIFSDGIEKDFLEFNSGTIARFGISAQAAHLVVG